MLCLIPSSKSIAAVTDRTKNIRSHGTLECVGNNSEDVLLTSADLTYLASEMNSLEDILASLQYKDNPNVTYTYHYHHKGDGTASVNKIYSLTEPGGCYKSAGHTHDALGACPYHIERCAAGVKEILDDSNNDGTGAWLYMCNKGHHFLATYHYDGQCTETSTIYDCGYPVNTWTIQCGWTQGSIESALTKFSPH